jgi:uncharacterized protein YndB with AHSA1/START domain
VPVFLWKRKSLNGKKITLSKFTPCNSEVSAALVFYKLFWETKLNSLEIYLNNSKKEIIIMNEDGIKTENGQIKELSLTRVFDAPIEKVFNAWIDPAQFAKWWGPKGFTNPVCELDVRPGGRILVHMTAPNGDWHPMGGTFHQITPPERLVFTTTAFENDKGEHMIENLNTVIFRDIGGKTELKLHVVVVKAAHEIQKALSGMEAGWSQSLDKLKDIF